ncbi:MAG: hypothetical protein L0Y56_03865, partial [Nitrospira sp.]|nr:hypothetical protein [Nitrospira sp.]
FLEYKGEVFATSTGDAIENFRRRLGIGQGVYAVPSTGRLTSRENAALKSGVHSVPTLPLNIHFI